MAVGNTAKRLPRQQPTSRRNGTRTHEASLRCALRPVCGQQRNMCPQGIQTMQFTWHAWLRLLSRSNASVEAGVVPERQHQLELMEAEAVAMATIVRQAKGLEASDG